MTTPETPENKNRRPGPGFALGVAAGAAIGVAMKNLAVGLSIGAGLGLLFASMRRKRD